MGALVFRLIGAMKTRFVIQVSKDPQNPDTLSVLAELYDNRGQAAEIEAALKVYYPECTYTIHPTDDPFIERWYEAICGKNLATEPSRTPTQIKYMIKLFMLLREHPDACKLAEPLAEHLLEQRKGEFQSQSGTAFYGSLFYSDIWEAVKDMSTELERDAAYQFITARMHVARYWIQSD